MDVVELKQALVDLDAKLEQDLKAARDNYGEDKELLAQILQRRQA